MIRNIARGYRNLLSSIAKILVLAAICLALGAGVVFPLWKWATASPASYTAVMVALILLAGAAWLIRAARRAGARAFCGRAARAAVVAGGLALCVYSVLHGRRAAVIAVLPATFLLYGILAFGFRKK